YQRVVNALMLFIGLAQDYHWRAIFSLEEAFHRRSGHGLVPRHVFAMQVACQKNLQRGKNYTRNYSDAHKYARVVGKLSFQQVVSAHAGHDKGRGNYRSAHVVRVLQDGPRIQQQSPETVYLKAAVGCPLERHRVLHPCVGNDDEISGEPRSEKYQEGSAPMCFWGEALFSVQKQAQK